MTKKKQMILLTLSLLILFVLITLFFALKGRKKPEQVSSITPTPIPIDRNATNVYPLNTIQISSIPVNGFSFVNNKLIYSSPKGIYYALDKKALLSKNIDEIHWGWNGVAVYKSEKSWFYIDFTKKDFKPSPLNITSDSINLSVGGKHLVEWEGNVFHLLDIETKTDVSKTLSSDIINTAWSPDGSKFAVSTNDKGKILVVVYDTSLNTAGQYTYDENTRLFALSNDGSVLSFNNNKFIYKNDEKEIFSFLVDQNAELSVNWINNSEFILIEKIQDDLGRKIDYVWKLDVNGGKELLTTSMPVINRFNLKIPVATSPDKKILLIAENNNIIWMVSLIPNKYPGYTDTGFVFIDLPGLDKGI